MSVRRPRFLGVVITACLLLVSLFVVLSVDSINFAGSAPPVNQHVVGAVEFGNLVVSTLIGESSTVCSNASEVSTAVKLPPIPNVPVSVYNQSSPTDLIQTMTTNSSGSIQTQLPVGKYIIKISDPRLQVLAPLQIYTESTTQLKVKACPDIYSVNFVDAFDTYSSGWVTSSQNIFVQVNSNQSIGHLNDYVFLDKVGTNPNAHEIGALVSQETLSGNSVWLVLQPQAPIPIDNLSNAQIVVYSPSFSINTHPS